MQDLVPEGLLHPATPPIFRSGPDAAGSPPIQPYCHQTDAIHRIIEGSNVAVSTGTGSGKSFAFGIPIVSERLRLRDQRVRGIKSLIEIGGLEGCSEIDALRTKE